MKIPLAIQLRALIYLLETSGSGHHSYPSVEDLFWQFLAETHPGDIEALRQRNIALLRDLYWDDFKRWRDERFASGELSDDEFIWHIAIGELGS